MEVRIRSWCCQLTTFVVCMAVIQTVLYFVMALGVILWYLLQHLRTPDAVYENIVEVSNLSDIFPHPDYTNIIILISGLIISFLGILTSLLLVVGVKTRQRSLLLPWLILHFCLILLIFIAGLYLIVYYTILLEEKDYLQAAFSLFLIVLGILFIFLWILVDQVFIRQKLESSLVPKSSARWTSSQSVTPHVMPWYPSDATGTVKRAKSAASVHSARSLRSVNQQREAHKNYRPADYSVNATLSRLANQKRLSRSLDHILDNSSSDSSNSRDSRAQVKEFKSLPRPRNRKTRRSGNSVGFHDRGRNNDTIRSCKSLTSAKSVTIDPQVREYRYQNSRSTESMDNLQVDLEDPVSFLDGVPPLHVGSVNNNNNSPLRRTVEDFSDEGVTEFRSSPETTDRVEKKKIYTTADRGRRDAAAVVCESSEGRVRICIPSPVYPRTTATGIATEHFLTQPRQLTRDEIISSYCDGASSYSDGDVAL